MLRQVLQGAALHIDEGPLARRVHHLQHEARRVPLLRRRAITRSVRTRGDGRQMKIVVVLAGQRFCGDLQAIEVARELYRFPLGDRPGGALFQQHAGNFIRKRASASIFATVAAAEQRSRVRVSLFGLFFFSSLGNGTSENLGAIRDRSLRRWSLRKRAPVECNEATIARLWEQVLLSHARLRSHLHLGDYPDRWIASGLPTIRELSHVSSNRYAECDISTACICRE